MHVLTALLIMVSIAGCDLFGPSENQTEVGANTVSAVAADEEALYADVFSTGQLGRSYDRGESWEVVQVFGEDEADGQSLRISEIATDGEVVFAGLGSFSEGMPMVRISEDEGETWKDFADGLPYHNLGIDDLEIGPDENVYAVTWGNVYRRDYGNPSNTWDVINTGTDAFQAGTLDIRNGVIYAAGAGGIRVSEDGETWTPVGDLDEDVMRINALAGRLVAGTTGGSVYEYDFDGETWTTIYDEPSDRLNPVQAIEETPEGLCVGWDQELVLRCFGNNGEMTESSIEIPNLEDVDRPGVRALLYGNTGRFFAGLHLGIAHSDDEGRTWTPTIQYPVELP